MPSSADDEDAQQQQQQQSGCKRPHASSELWEFESFIAAEPPKSKVVLGVDGGGTCTVCVCVAAPVVVPRDGSLPLLSRCVTGSSNHNSVGDAVARRAIEESMAGALMKACIPRSAVQAVCLALAGVDSPSDGEAYLSWMRCSFLHPFS
jgi:N-acetylglucosamine kinase-like BadF-type ATPase